MGGEPAPPLTGGAAVLARIKQARAAAEASAAQAVSSLPAAEEKDAAPQVRAHSGSKASQTSARRPSFRRGDPAVP